MLKKGGIFLGILLSLTAVFAQDKTEELFRHNNNPHLLNLGEAKAAKKGETLVYIEGVRAPETAHNDIEALQLELFGTKNIKEATKNTLELSKDTLAPPPNQIHDFVMQTPFHGFIQTGFIRHIPSFVITVQILNQKQLLISEDVSVMNTDKNEYWTREIPLPEGSTAQLISYTQNGKVESLESIKPIQNTLSFKASQPLLSGPNQLNLTYQLDNPFNGDKLNLDLTGLDFTWPIEKFSTLVMYPTPLEFKENRLLFGANQLDISNIYTKKVDPSNTAFSIQRIIPPHGSIHVSMQFDPNQLPLPEPKQLLSRTFILGLVLLILYLVFFAYSERRQAHHLKPKKLKGIPNILTLAKQMEANLTTKTWALLSTFCEHNAWAVSEMAAMQDIWTKDTRKDRIKLSIRNFFALTLEPIIGVMILIVGIELIEILIEQTFSPVLCALLIIGSLLGISLLYLVVLKPARKHYWEKSLIHFAQPQILIGLTKQQVCQIYPLFILSHKHEEWQQALIHTNPKLAKTVHLM